MNFNLGELESLFENINEIINFIEISQYQKRRNRIYLGNGDKINFSVPNDTIAHLLGINTNYLIYTGRFNSTSSFEVLKEMLENPYRINQLKNEGIIKYEYLFSPYILNKIKGFKENIKINIDETELVCKYKSSRAYISDEQSEKYDYIIVKKYDNGKFGILGLVQKENYYVPMSNQLFDSFDKLKENLEKYLKNQEISIITGVNVFNTESDYDKTFSLCLNHKLNKIKNIRNYKRLFDCSLDLTEDYEYSIDKLKENRLNHFEDNDLIEIIVTSIKNGKLIDTEITRDTALSKIIESFNDFLCNNSTNQDSSITESYSKLKSDLEKFKSMLLEYQEKNERLTEENNVLNSKVESLESINHNNEIISEKILELLNKKPRM